MIVCKLSDLQVFVFSPGYDGGPTTFIKTVCPQKPLPFLQGKD